MQERETLFTRSREVAKRQTMIMPADAMAGQMRWWLCTGYCIATQFNFYDFAVESDWLQKATLKLGFALTLVAQNIYFENSKSKFVLTINLESNLSYLGIKTHAHTPHTLRNKHGNWSLATDTSLVSVGIKCKAFWGDTSKTKMHRISIITACFA